MVGDDAKSDQASSEDMAGGWAQVAVRSAIAGVIGIAFVWLMASWGRASNLFFLVGFLQGGVLTWRLIDHAPVSPCRLVGMIFLGCVVITVLECIFQTLIAPDSPGHVIAPVGAMVATMFWVGLWYRDNL
jgi:hypothetical protein